ncbi:MAG TPA: VOC family protein [Chloroflexota bacterium]|nr:VOC family protein [Chloroflexota bacterium]
MIEMQEKQAAERAPASTTPIRVRKIGHIVYTVSDIDRSVKFWTEIMGFKVSDTNERGMVFLRCQTDHHTIGLAPAGPDAKRPGKNTLGTQHFAMEVASVDELFKAREFVKSKGLEIVAEGRRGPGSNIEVHFLDPDGYDIELYAEMEQVGWDGHTRPAEYWRRASSLEEAVANPVPTK